MPRNLDRVPIHRRRREAETVAQMRDQHWDVISKCQACGLVMKVDLAAVAKAASPKLSLWNRHPRCRRMFCHGRVDFQARAPGMDGHQLLDAEWPDPSDYLPDWLAQCFKGPVDKP